MLPFLLHNQQPPILPERTSHTTLKLRRYDLAIGSRGALRNKSKEFFVESDLSTDLNNQSFHTVPNSCGHIRAFIVATGQFLLEFLRSDGVFCSHPLWCTTELLADISVLLRTFRKPTSISLESRILSEIINTITISNYCCPENIVVSKIIIKLDKQFLWKGILNCDRIHETMDILDKVISPGLFLSVHIEQTKAVQYKILE